MHKKIDKQTLQQLKPIINECCYQPQEIINEIWEYYEKTAPSNIHTNFPGFKFGWKYHCSKSKLLVVEQPPMVRLLKFQGTHGKTVKPYSLPYLVFVIRKDAVGSPEIQCYCRKEPLTSVEDIVYQCPLPNTTSANFICLGKSGEYYPHCSSNENLLSWVFQEFWSSSFTREVTDNLDELAYKDYDHFGSMSAWTKWSQNNPQYALQAPYLKLGQLNKYFTSFVKLLKQREERLIYKAIMNIIIAHARDKKTIRDFLSEGFSH